MSTPRRKRLDSAHSDDHSDRPLPVSAALFVARALALIGLALVASLVALIAWFTLKSTLRVDPIVGRERVWLQYGHHRPPYAQVHLQEGRYAVPGPAYDISLEAIVPVNDNNLRLGNFMVALSLVDVDGTPLLNVSRPSILDPLTLSAVKRESPRSSSSFLKSIASAPFSLLTSPLGSLCPGSANFLAGSTARATLTIPLLEKVALAESVVSAASCSSTRKRSRWRKRVSIEKQGPVDSIWVEIGRKDAHPRETSSMRRDDDDADKVEERRSVRKQAEGVASGRSRELQVYEAWIKVEVKPSGLRALIYHHPWITFAVFFPTFLTFEAIAALAIYLYFVATSSTSDQRRVKEEIVEEEVPIDRQAFLGARPAGFSGTSSETEEGPTTSATPSDYDRISDVEGPLRDAEAEEEAQAREQQRVEADRLRLRLGQGGVGMTAVSLAGEGEGGVENGEDVGVLRSASDVEEDKEAEWIKEEAGGEESASVIAASATTRQTASTFGPSLAGTSSTGLSSAAGARASQAGLRERAAAATSSRIKEDE